MSTQNSTSQAAISTLPVLGNLAVRESETRAYSTSVATYYLTELVESSRTGLDTSNIGPDWRLSYTAIVTGMPIDQALRVNKVFSDFQSTSALGGWIQVGSAELPNIDLLSERPINQLRWLIKDGQISEARRHALFLTAINPYDESIARIRSIVDKPSVKLTQSATGKSIRGNMEWVKMHGSTYHGMWVALDNGSLLRADESRTKLQAWLKENNDTDHVMILKVE
ncbi:MAG: hypothetical protein WBR15_04260 [Gammaproteobacteria bacterium]